MANKNKHRYIELKKIVSMSVIFNNFLYTTIKMSVPRLNIYDLTATPTLIISFSKALHFDCNEIHSLFFTCKHTT